MKSKLIPLLTVLAFTATAQQSQPIELNWKIAKGEELNYTTVMSEIDTSSIDINLDEFFKEFPDDKVINSKEIRVLFDQVNQAMKNTDFTTTFSSKEDNVIDIATKIKVNDNTSEPKSEQDKMVQKMQSINGGIVLRGAVYGSGAIQSFWLGRGQKNLIALFAQLPVIPVKVNDKWSLDVNLISLDQNFKAEKSSRVNEVMLTELKETNGEMVAVLTYNIAEYVSGELNVPSFDDPDEKKPTIMSYSFQGIAEFSVSQGRWLSYDGILSMKSSGIMDADIKQKFTLIKQ